MVYYRCMDLYAYLKPLSEDEVARLAVQCRTTPLYLWKMARAHRRGQYLMKPLLACLLETATNQKVKRWESIPDEWHIVWPELIGSPGAPPIPVTPHISGCCEEVSHA